MTSKQGPHPQKRELQTEKGAKPWHAEAWGKGEGARKGGGGRIFVVERFTPLPIPLIG